MSSSSSGCGCLLCDRYLVGLFFLDYAILSICVIVQSKIRLKKLNLLLGYIHGDLMSRIQ